MSGSRLAVVTSIDDIQPHPNADRLELLTLLEGEITLVAGKHYRIGQRGVYIRPGAVLPGYLAEDLWLCGRGRSNEWHPIVTKNMRGIESPGMFCGEIYQKVRADPRSVERAETQIPLQDPAGEWFRWPFWRDHWKQGEDVSAYLGIRSAIMPWNRTGPQTPADRKSRLDAVATNACKATVEGATPG